MKPDTETLVREAAYQLGYDKGYQDGYDAGWNDLRAAISPIIASLKESVALTKGVVGEMLEEHHG